MEWCEFAGDQIMHLSIPGYGGMLIIGSIYTMGCGYPKQALRPSAILPGKDGRCNKHLPPPPRHSLLLIFTAYRAIMVDNAAGDSCIH